MKSHRQIRISDSLSRSTFLVILVVSAFLPFAASQDPACFSHFYKDGVPLELGAVLADVNDNKPEGELVYVLTWDEGFASAPIRPDEDILEYFEFDETDPNTWNVKVKKNLSGATSYPKYLQSLRTDVTFTGTEACKIDFQHNLIDKNTEAPEFNQASYAVTIREDYPIDFDIADLEIRVLDKDREGPNNEFSVTVTGTNCNLKASQNSYGGGDCTSGCPFDIPVWLQLSSPLNYEENDELSCFLQVADKGNPILETKDIPLLISVENKADEPPRFTELFYYSTLTASVEGEVLDVDPGPISAQDADGATVTYSMDNARADIDGLIYFEIDPSSGVVRVKQDLDNTILEAERVHFILKATADTRVAFSMLDIRVPFNHPDSGLQFEKYTYVSEVVWPRKGQEVLRVRATEPSGSAEISYAFEGGEDERFSIDSKTGLITVKTDDLEIETYELTAVATAGELRDTAMVLISVVEPLCADAIMRDNLIQLDVDEGSHDEELHTIMTLVDVDEVCITDLQPAEAEGYFTVVEDGNMWKIKTDGDIDYESVKTATFKVKAVVDGGTCESGQIDNQILRNEALVVVTINDLNDEEPTFVIPSKAEEVVAYPVDVSLQKVVGPVVLLQAEDSDSTPTYSLESEIEGLVVDETTGALYLQEGNTCGQKCQVTVSASDDVHTTSATITILPLDMNHIYSMTLSNVALESIDDELADISSKSGVQISKLYVTPLASESSRAVREESWELKVHVYAVDGEALLSLGQLNQKLEEGSTNLEASSFEDKETFAPTQTEDPRIVGFQVAVGILGALLGIILVGTVAFFIYRWSRGGDKKYEEPKKISTVGGAYPNLSFTNEEDRTDSGSQGQQNGSIRGGGFSVEDRRDSPPLYRSPLSKQEPMKNNYSKPARSEANKPDYYSTSSSTSSSSKPYPNLSSTTSSAYPNLPSASSSSSTPPKATTSSTSSSSMYPSLYQSKAQKKAPPPTGTAPAKSILRGAAGGPAVDQVPMAVFTPEKEPKEPEKDYDEVKTSSFSGLKGSPPPKRATHEESEEGSGDDDDDERRKSVAFKIMVDTKEIQAENEGPSQKKAAAKNDALDILEANKKRMEEQEDGSEDEDVDEKF